SRRRRGRCARPFVLEPQALRLHACAPPHLPARRPLATTVEPRRLPMPSAAFGAADFKVFEVKGFAPRMSEIRARIRPKLETLGQRLLPEVSRAIGAEAFVHVAKHARRMVNPPDDTWVAFGPDKRGYKKHCHFKVAVSRNAVRFLFEVGPEHADKKRWAAA